MSLSEKIDKVYHSKTEIIFYEILTYVRDWRFLPAARYPRVDDDYTPAESVHMVEKILYKYHLVFSRVDSLYYIAKEIWGVLKRI